MGAALQYRVLGPVDVLAGDGHLVDLGRRKQRALLAVLVIEANRVVPLDRLVDLLWPEEPPAQAIGSIHAYVSNLRRVLEPGRGLRAADGILATRAPGYVLRVPEGAVDSDRFEALLGDGQRRASAGDHEADRDAIDEALALWRGPAFADFADQPFVMAEAMRMEELRLVAVEARLEAELALGHAARTVAELERLVALYPLRERLWGLFMVALYRSGRQCEALRASNSARTLLKEQLGVEPGPDLRALEADILAQSPALRGGVVGTGMARAPVPPAPPADAGAAAEAQGWGGAAIVGRKEESAVLDAALARAARGRGGLVLVSGEPGIGKTRLAEALAARAVTGGAVVAWGRCYEGAGAPAFWPWSQVMRSLLSSFGADDIREALGTGAADLAQVFHEVRALAGSAGPPDGLDPEIIRFRAYQALGSFMARLSGVRPLVVILDDLHRADLASLGVVEFLAGTLDGAALLMVATYRHAEVNPTGHPLTATLGALARRPVVDVGPLSGLSVEDVAQLMAAEIGSPPDQALAATVRARTEGNPFFVTELIKLMQSRAWRSGRGEPNLARDVPGRVRDVVRGHLVRLPEATVAVLELAAVVGRDFDLDVLERAAGLEPEEAQRHIEAALVSGLVADDADVVGRYRFCHALVQDALYGELHAVRRARLHWRVADALEALHAADEDRVGELAFHYGLAATADARVKAFAYTVQAADVANGRLAYEQAVEHLHRALDLMTSVPEGPARDGAELGVQLHLAGWTTMIAGWVAPAPAAAWARAGELARSLGAMPQLLGALWGQWVVALMSGDGAGAEAVAAELVERGETTDDPTFRLAGACTAGYGFIHRGAFEKGLELGDATAAMARSVTDDWLIETFHLHLGVLALSTSAWAAYLLGDDEGATRRADEALAVTGRIRHPFSRAAGTLAVAVLHVLRGDVENARRFGEQTVEVSAEYGIRPYLAFGRAVRGWAVAHEGDPEAGAAEAEEALAAMELAGWVHMRPLCLGLLAQAWWRCGRTADALTAFDRALAAAEACNDRYWEPELHRLRADLLAAHWPDRGAEAEAALATAAALAERQQAVPIVARVAESRARLDASTGGARTRPGPHR